MAHSLYKVCNGINTPKVTQIKAVCCLTEKFKESEIHLRIDHLYPDATSEKEATGIGEKADSWQLGCLELSEITGNILKGSTHSGGKAVKCEQC